MQYYLRILNDYYTDHRLQKKSRLHAYNSRLHIKKVRKGLEENKVNLPAIGLVVQWIV